MYFPFAATTLDLAFSEAPNEATVKAWFKQPEPKILPGTTTVSARFVFLFKVLKLTLTR
jgi:hypothetical protein